jgi:hypothetical protein
MVLTVNPAITYGAFERMKSLILVGGTASKLTPGKAFLVGALSKTLATVVCAPIPPIRRFGLNLNLCSVGYLSLHHG